MRPFQRQQRGAKEFKAKKDLN